MCQKFYTGFKNGPELKTQPIAFLQNHLKFWYFSRFPLMCILIFARAYLIWNAIFSLRQIRPNKEIIETAMAGGGDIIWAPPLGWVKSGNPSRRSCQLNPWVRRSQPLNISPIVIAISQSLEFEVLRVECCKHTEVHYSLMFIHLALSTMAFFLETRYRSNQRNFSA